jgi:hypothetical protein
MVRLLRHTRVLGAIVALGLLLGAAPRAARPAKLRQLAGINDLKVWFNANRGHPKAIVLLSPT